MSEKWVTAWGNAISVAERRPENYAKNLTLRYPAKMMLDGSALRITLDNFCGNEPVHLTGATVAVSDGADGILPETLVPLTFSGNAGVTIPAGERLQSDAAAFPVEKGTTIAVSLYFAEFTEMRSGVVITGPLSGGYFAMQSFSGDCGNRRAGLTRCWIRILRKRPTRCISSVTLTC